MCAVVITGWLSYVECIGDAANQYARDVLSLHSAVVLLVLRDCALGHGDWISP